MRLYALHDYDQEFKKRGAFEIKKSRVKQYNREGYGIFMAVNEFNGRRRRDNLTKILFWLADIDEGTKDDMMLKIDELTITPSVIVETKKGYHCYWRAIDATVENYTDIEEGLIKRLNADKGCKDVTRLLRYPSAYHMKDKDNPFLVKVVRLTDREYTEAQMLCAYRLPKTTKNYKKPLEKSTDTDDFLDETRWERIFKLSQIGEGNRNSMFTRYIYWMRDLNLTAYDIHYIINGINRKISRPLPQYEIDTLLKSKGI